MNLTRPESSHAIEGIDTRERRIAERIYDGENTTRGGMKWRRSRRVWPTKRRIGLQDKPPSPGKSKRTTPRMKKFFFFFFFVLGWDGVSVLELEFSCDHIRLAFVRYLRCLMHLSKWNVPEGLGLRLIPAWLG